MRGQQTESFTLNGISELPLSTGVSGNSRSRPFPRMEGSDSRSQIMGMDFFPPFPFQNFGNAFFIPFPFPNYGNGFFFIPFPFPNYGNGFFSSPSRSRIEGMGFFNSLPVPELREWNYPFPFPFPNSQMSFPLTAASTIKFQCSLDHIDSTLRAP